MIELAILPFFIRVSIALIVVALIFFTLFWTAKPTRKEKDLMTNNIFRSRSGKRFRRLGYIYGVVGNEPDASLGGAYRFKWLNLMREDGTDYTFAVDDDQLASIFMPDQEWKMLQSEKTTNNSKTARNENRRTSSERVLQK
jgi:hypothetical protein